MSTDIRFCPARACNESIPHRHLLCPDHWARVSHSTKQEVIAQWREVKRVTGTPPRSWTEQSRAEYFAVMRAYRQACAAAVAEANAP